MASSITQMGMVRGGVFMHDARLWVGQPNVSGESPLGPRVMFVPYYGCSPTRFME